MATIFLFHHGRKLFLTVLFAFSSLTFLFAQNSIFQPSDGPVTGISTGPAVELGVKFKTTQNGFITGVKFYKGSGNTGTHIGNLWSSTGTLLASATFAGESATGWQTVVFGTPVAITAGTTYVASYFSTAGNYSINLNYFSAAVVNGPLRALSNGEDGPNGVYNFSAGSSFPANGFNNSNYWVDVVYTSSIGPDLTPPLISSTSPANAATNVSTLATVTVTFNEAVDPATISSSTFELRNASNALVPSTITYNAATYTATLTPAAALANTIVYTALIKGGSTNPRVKDIAGNALATNYSWSFTTASPVTQISIFQPTDAPTRGISAGGTPLELGVKFRTTQNGFITGIQFYKGAGTTGTHIGNLWTNYGTLLARANFTGETASGWQKVFFTAPVAVSTGITYVASCFFNSGDYSITSPYFTSAVVNVPLRALANGEDGPNGLYNFTPTTAFPANGFNSSNYWVDVIYTANTGPDLTPPAVLSTTPANGATGVNISTAISTAFSEAIDPATVNSSTFELRNAANTVVPSIVSYNSSTSTATLTPVSTLAATSVYTAVLKGGSTDPRIKDIAGNALAANYSWSFTTTYPQPTDGPGGPILVISSASNPFSLYTAEILCHQ